MNHLPITPDQATFHHIAALVGTSRTVHSIPVVNGAYIDAARTIDNRLLLWLHTPDGRTVHFRQTGSNCYRMQ